MTSNDSWRTPHSKTSGSSSPPPAPPWHSTRPNKGKLDAFLLLAAPYHVAGHRTSKALLSLEAGVVEHSTGTRDMDRLGGLVRTLPRSTVIVLTGTLGIAALPPLASFGSEWMIFQGLFQGFRIPNHLVAVLVVIAGAGAALGLSGGLAIAAFTRAFGINVYLLYVFLAVLTAYFVAGL